MKDYNSNGVFRLLSYRDRAAGTYHLSREEMEHDDAGPPLPRPVHPRRRPRPSGGLPTGSLAAQLALFAPAAQLPGDRGDSSNSRSGSRSRRSAASREGGGGGSGPRGYRVERHAHYPTRDGSN